MLKELLHAWHLIRSFFLIISRVVFLNPALLSDSPLTPPSASLWWVNVIFDFAKFKEFLASLLLGGNTSHIPVNRQGQAAQANIYRDQYTVLILIWAEVEHCCLIPAIHDNSIRYICIQILLKMVTDKCWYLLQKTSQTKSFSITALILSHRGLNSESHRVWA